MFVARTGFVDLEIPSGQDVFAAVDGYQASGLVEIVEPDAPATPRTA